MIAFTFAYFFAFALILLIAGVVAPVMQGGRLVPSLEQQVPAQGLNFFGPLHGPQAPSPIQMPSFRFANGATLDVVPSMFKNLAKILVSDRHQMRVAQEQATEDLSATIPSTPKALEPDYIEVEYKVVEEPCVQVKASIWGNGKGITVNSVLIPFKKEVYKDISKICFHKEVEIILYEDRLFFFGQEITLSRKQREKLNPLLT